MGKNAITNPGVPAPSQVALAAPTACTATIMLFHQDGSTYYASGSIPTTGITMHDFVGPANWDPNYARWFPLRTDGDFYFNFTAQQTLIGTLPTANDFIVREGSYNAELFDFDTQAFLADEHVAVSNTILRMFATANTWTGSSDPFNAFNRYVTIANMSLTLDLYIKEIDALAVLTSVVSSSIWNYRIPAFKWSDPIYVPAGRELAIVRSSSSSDACYALLRSAQGA